MNRPRSATLGTKKMYLGNKSQDQNKYIIPPESLPNIQYKQQSSYYELLEDELKEELNLIKNSWEDLGIAHEYRITFINLIKKVNENERKDILMQEKLNLKKFRDGLLNLKKQIAHRENNLFLLKNVERNLENSLNVENNKKLIDKILQDAINIIKALRLSAINIVSKSLKVNQLLSYYSDSGKFNTNKIKMDYSYDPNYLSKMKEDLLFLKKSVLNLYIEMNNSEIDPFLTNCAPAPNSKSNNFDEKITIPISDDIMKLIIESRYSLLQNTVLSNINQNESLNLRKFDYDFNDNYSNKNVFRSLEEDKFRLNSNKHNIINNYNNYTSKKKIIFSIIKI